jgi:hypothetical protein
MTKLITDSENRAQNIPRGVFINTATANCSIYESGRMIYGCIKGSKDFDIDYFSLDTIDVSLFATEGRIKPLGDMLVGKQDRLGRYDFWVFNWHPVTMASHLDPACIAKLPGRKFTLVLELEPDDPLRGVPPGVFDAYIALDPTTPATDRIFPFPRPLDDNPRRPIPLSHDVPVIGSFGFGTPGKGFELLVDAVNREFEKSVVRINIPSGTYAAFDGIHGQSYPKYIASLCKRIAKPGIDVCFTDKFMSPSELVSWCGGNDLNCFMYTRRQPGLSATTDQAIISGRPLLTSSNDTFRHIHRYISPYPVTSLRQAIETTAPLVGRMQQDWSRASFSTTFCRMLATFGLITLRSMEEATLATKHYPRPSIMVASPRGPYGDGIIWYPTRLADCLRRPGKYNVLSVTCEDLSDLKEWVAKLQPHSVIVLNLAAVGREVLAEELKIVAGPKILLVKDAQASGLHSARNHNGVLILPQRPIIPYYTSTTELRKGPPRIWLIGFAAQKSNLEEIVAKIRRDLQEAEILLEVPDEKRSDFERRAAKLSKRLLGARGVHLSVASLPANGDEIVRNFAESRLAIFYNDPERTEDLESISSLALTTERAVAFTRSAPFPGYLDGGTYVEDFAIAYIINLGMAAQIKLCCDFEEWRMFADIDRLLQNNLTALPYIKTELPRNAETETKTSYLAGSMNRPSEDPIREVCGVSTTAILARCRLLRQQRQISVGTSAPDSKSMSNLTVWRLVDLGDGSQEEFVEAVHLALLGRVPLKQEASRRMAMLRGGSTRLELILRLAFSPEGRRLKQPPVAGVLLPALVRLVRAAERLAHSPPLSVLLRAARSRH